MRFQKKLKLFITDKLNHSLWLTRLDQETSDLKIRLIKILFISLNNYQYFNIFLIPPPDNLSDLNLETDNTVKLHMYGINN